ncbi:uncharacterized protein [Parasteatoda tepidariorum]|uniref:uncharacterized protein isoform X1 n=1 Tax=Parasteatoda tepidariorum TaxID=114398 RepID=UPI0039BCFF83
MKSNLLLVFAFIVWGKTQANDRCSESRITRGTHSCFRNFMANFRIGREEEECGRELKTLEDCLAPVVDECTLDDEHRFAVRIKIKELKAKIRGTCSNKALATTEPSSLLCSPKIVEWRATNCYTGLLKLIGQDHDTLLPQVCG